MTTYTKYELIEPLRRLIYDQVKASPTRWQTKNRKKTDKHVFSYHVSINGQ